MKYLTVLLFGLFQFSNAFLPSQNDFGLKIVKSTSGMLANADSVGHRVLNGNKIIIDYLLDHKEIAIQYKKPVILFLIETAQMGDSAGSQILETYHTMVDHLL